jgi:hypothetical protein
VKQKLFIVAVILLLIIFGGVVYFQNLKTHQQMVTQDFQPCDIDRNGVCDQSDKLLFEKSLGQCTTGNNYNEVADADHDGCVTEKDREELFPSSSTPQVSPSPKASPNATGCDPGVDSGSPVNPCRVVNMAKADLAKRLGGTEDQLGISQTVEQVEWPDACLGASSTDQMCAQVITPGYKVTFEVSKQGGKKYLYHTDKAEQFIYIGPQN